MTDTQVRGRVSVDDLVRLGEDAWVEVVDGELVKTDMSAAGHMHVIFVENLFRLLDSFVRSDKLGRVHTDGLTYILHVDEMGVQTARIPDFSFIRRGRITP